MTMDGFYNGYDDSDDPADSGNLAVADAALTDNVQNTDVGADDDHDIVSELRMAGIENEALLEKVRKGTMLHADYTRKRQAESAEVKQLQAEIAQMKQAFMQQPQMGAQPQSQDELDSFLQAMGADPEGDPEQYNNLKRAFQIWDKRMEAKTQQVIGPYVQSHVQAQLNQNLAEARTQMTREYGKDFEQYWPQVEQAFRQSFAQGQVYSPDVIFWHMFPDKAKQLKLASDQRKSAQQARQQTNTMQGFEQFSSSAPPDKRHLGYMPQNGNGMPDLNALTNMALKRSGMRAADFGG